MEISKMLWQHSYVWGNWNDKSTNQTNVSGILRAIEDVFIREIAWNPMSKRSIFMPLNFKCQIGSAMWPMISGVWANEKHICSIFKEEKDLPIALSVCSEHWDRSWGSIIYQYWYNMVVHSSVVILWETRRTLKNRSLQYTSTRDPRDKSWGWSLLRIPSL